MKFKFRKGFDIIIGGAPEQVLHDGRAVSSLAILGRDFPGIRPDFRVAEGDWVRTGQLLFVDRKRPRICFTAPAAGRVNRIIVGRRRMLDSLVIGIDADEFETFKWSCGASDRQSVAEVLLASGMWTSFRRRPFDGIPDPDTVPEAIFVTAMATDPLAADAAVVLEPHMEQFQRGLDALTFLTDGAVFVCQAPGPDLAAGNERIRIVTFAGPHPAGLPGTHIHHLMPASAKRTVWHIGYQDVAAIGYLLETGRLWTESTVALGGPGIRRPRLIRTRSGASLEDLVAGEISEYPVQLVSGSVLSGRESTWLGRYHTQVTALQGGRMVYPRSFPRWGLGWLPPAATSPTIPIESLDSAMPLDILPVPLMRALSIGDIESAERLGCLELVEEDVALLSWLCPGRTNYGALLRKTLEELRGDQP